MSFTLDKSHFDISPWNEFTPMKMSLMSVILDTSHSPIDPCVSLEQFNSGDNFRQVVTALLSSTLDCGENINWQVHKFGEMEIRRVNKVTWMIMCVTCMSQCLWVHHNISMHVRRSASIYHSLVSMRRWFTGAYSQRFEIVPSNSIETSRARAYGGNDNATDWFKGRGRRTNVTSDCTQEKFSHLCCSSSRSCRLQEHD